MLPAVVLALVSLEAASMCQPSWGRVGDFDVVTALDEESELDVGRVVVLGFVSLAQSRSERGRIWLAAVVGSLGEGGSPGGKGSGQKLGCLGSVGESRKESLASCKAYSNLEWEKILKITL